MQIPLYTEQEATARETFLALMWALSYPGRTQNLPERSLSPFQIIGEALLDLETSFFTLNPFLKDALATSGARFLSPDRAAYHFYPILDEEALEAVKHASNGTMLFPDQSATLIIGCELAKGPTRQLTGPGISGESQFQASGIPNEFWMLRENANRYPFGWDVFLVDELQVIGLPRTTKISD